MPAAMSGGVLDIKVVIHFKKSKYYMVRYTTIDGYTGFGIVMDNDLKGVKNESKS